MVLDGHKREAEDEYRTRKRWKVSRAVIRTGGKDTTSRLMSNSTFWTAHGFRSSIACIRTNQGRPSAFTAKNFFFLSFFITFINQSINQS